MASPAVIAKMPGTPMAALRNGEIAKDTAKETPIVEPMIAIALPRWLSRVRSAAIAITTPEMAPAPCSARPKIMAAGEAEAAQTRLPAANSASPA